MLHSEHEGSPSDLLRESRRHGKHGRIGLKLKPNSMMKEDRKMEELPIIANIQKQIDELGIKIKELEA